MLKNVVGDVSLRKEELQKKLDKPSSFSKAKLKLNWFSDNFHKEYKGKISNNEILQLIMNIVSGKV